MTAEPEPEPALKFEDALKRLESLVEDLERGEPELSAALSKYEEGVRLLARCHGVLDQAEQSVSLLVGVDGDGKPLTSPFDAETSETIDPAPPARPARSRKRPTPPTPPTAPAGGADDAPIPF